MTAVEDVIGPTRPHKRDSHEGTTERRVSLRSVFVCRASATHSRSPPARVYI
jgi:hypothetical protein